MPAQTHPASRRSCGWTLVFLLAWSPPCTAAEAAGLGDDAAEMQRRNRTWYARLAARIDGSVVAPVGDAWALNDAKMGAPRLHAADNSHPAFSGSYLAALVIYGTIYDTDTLAVDYRGGLSEAEAAQLQGVATEALRAAAAPAAP